MMEQNDGFTHPATGRLSVARILELKVLRDAEPLVLAGADSLENVVRWVHVAESADMAGLLQGGELVLSTGLAFRGPGAGAHYFLRQIREAGAAGVVIELAGAGDEVESSVQGLRAAAREVDYPVVLVRKRMRFVEVTEVVHRMLVSDQLAALERSRTIHEVFTALSLESASEEHIVARAAELIEAPVVLEDVGHLVLAFETAGSAADELLEGWTERSRRVRYREATGRSANAPESWLQAPVGVRGRRWGRLVVPGPLVDDDDAALVLERAGQTLTIARLAGRDERELLHQARAGLLHELRQPHALSDAAVAARAAALGLGAAVHYVPLVLRLDAAPGEAPTGLQLRERELLEVLGTVLASTRNQALAASLQSGSIGVLLGLSARQLEEPALERICGQLADELGGSRFSAGVGRGYGSIGAAAHGLDEAAQVAETVATFDSRTRRFYRFADVRLRGLLSLLASNARLATFAEAELAGILNPPDAEALELLELYLRHGGNKSALARTGYLSRPALYARLAKLEARLGVSLEDAESRTSLHVALLWRRVNGQAVGREAVR
ncbi:PucR family transcriptional regulator ligand-binding domain-containing protein [Paeniglutamicibacter cryotolerans]|uniref:Purine catabolism regulator n=1 Tax=Paeniglutamicibacter cryotolerans TaxID=670079 RepID=A0A839QIJ6_9MICC|nr:PucR family transcriptional regulator ligand-binding domain-containing protein [Paeniglutamicibacter cryotolerans]MBB2994355.1 purine catabolism regulator [Paeniglutamicibacter cryotolerans]